MPSTTFRDMLAGWRGNAADGLKAEVSLRPPTSAAAPAAAAASLVWLRARHSSRHRLSRLSRSSAEAPGAGGPQRRTAGPAADGSAENEHNH